MTPLNSFINKFIMKEKNQNLTMGGKQEYKEYIGKVIISDKYPAKANCFYAWVNPNNLKESIEVGSWIIAEDEDIQYFCTVEEIQTISHATLYDEFYGSKMGTPTEEPRIIPEAILVLKLRVLWNNKDKFIAPTSRLRIRFPTLEEMRKYFALTIPEDERILCGFAKTSFQGREEYVPLYLRSSYLLGPESAHVNISGISGLASKTSYALFLAYSIYAWAQNHNKKVAIILFNVKGDDFLWLHRKIENEEAFKDELKDWARDNEALIERIDRMYKLFEQEYGKSLWKVHNELSEEGKIRYFTYKDDPYLDHVFKEAEEDKEKIVRYYRYALWDLDADCLIAGLFEPQEEREATHQVSFIYQLFDSKEDVFEKLKSGRKEDILIKNFDDLITELSEGRPQGREREILIDVVRETSPIPIHVSSARALARRLRGLLSKGKRVLDKKAITLQVIPEDKDSKKEGPINTGKERKIIEGFNVIQLVGLHRVEQRILVLDVLRKVFEELSGKDRRFDYVVVIIDELNQYAPKTYSAWKHLIIDISARGREKKISLVGIEQFASRVDPEVIGNCATIVVGRQNTVEIAHEFYKQIGEFKEITHMLDKGELVIYHSLYQSPFRITFPIPPAKLISKK